MVMVLVLSSLVVAIYMDTESRMFTDEIGRSLIFHGFNVVVKLPPYIPITDYFDPQMSLNDDDISYMQNWGFNFVRLGVMWEAVEYAPEKYNLTYLAEMDSLIKKLGKAGIYTLVDAHQDVFARHLCGEGVPNFYAEYLEDTCRGFGKILEYFGSCTRMSNLNLTMDSNGNPLVKDCLKNSFVLYYETPEGMSAFERLYKNTNGLQDRFADFWDVVSKYYKNNPYVLGYDMINEPLTANTYSEPWLLIPGVFDRLVLQPLYQRINSVIRSNDKEKILFFEPTQGDVIQAFGGIVANSGFTETPGGADYNKAQILNDHAYCCQSGGDICSTGEPPLDKADQCRRFNYDRVTTRAADAKALNVGLIISEFGACTGSEACAAEIKGVTDACDSNLVGWGYWMYKGFGDFTTTGSYTEGLWDEKGKLEETKLKALSRTYVEKFEGVPISMKFNSDTGDFVASYELKWDVKAPTLVYLNEELFYPNGYLLSVENSENVEYKTESRKNAIEVLFEDPKESVTTIRIKAK